MGGFVVDVSPIHDTFTYTTIMPAGLMWLAEHGYFIELPESAIQDRSKADVLAKTLVCIQVAWLIIQSTGRAANGLPIALLEVHVLAHVACALLLYIIWFKKPLGIKEATRVDSSKFNDEIALMLVLSLGGAENERRLANRQIVDGPNTSENSEPPVIDRSPSRIEPETRDSGEHLDGVSSITPKDTERWSRANRAEGRGWPPYPQRLYVSKRAKDAEALGFFLDGRLDELQRSLGQHLLVMGLIVFLTAAYAAIHLTAWGYHFPTKTEMWLWRGSSLTIASIAPVFLTLFLITTQAEWPDRFQDLKRFLYGVMEILLFLIYFSARLFLLIAAFISVREMPIGVFVTMQWSDYIPHL